MDDEVVVGIGWIAGAAFVRFNRPVGDGEVVGVDMLFSFEIECGHGEIPLGTEKLIYSIQVCSDRQVVLLASFLYLVSVASHWSHPWVHRLPRQYPRGSLYHP